jgi:very-long-chain ceramide synthase
MSGDPIMQVEDKIVPGPSVTSAETAVEETIIRQDVTVITTATDEATGPNSALSGTANPTSPTTAAPRPRLKKDNSTPNMNGPLYMQTAGNKTVLVRRLKRKEESTWKHLSRWFVENQIGTLLSNLLFSCRSWIASERAMFVGVSTVKGVKSKIQTCPWLMTLWE